MQASFEQMKRNVNLFKTITQQIEMREESEAFSLREKAFYGLKYHSCIRRNQRTLLC